MKSMRHHEKESVCSLAIKVWIGANCGYRAHSTTFGRKKKEKGREDQNGEKSYCYFLCFFFAMLMGLMLLLSICGYDDIVAAGRGNYTRGLWEKGMVSNTEGRIGTRKGKIRKSTHHQMSETRKKGGEDDKLILKSICKRHEWSE